jgi:TatD DNase family protein
MDEAQSVPGLVDTHTHLNHPRLLPHLAPVLERAREAGVGEMIVVGYDLPSSSLAVELAEQHGGLRAAVGVHPHDADVMDDAAAESLRSLAKSEAVVAIGETGLDFYRDLSPRDTQMAAFVAHLALADEMGLPVIVHCRAAQEELLGVLASRAEGRSGDSTLIWHCFDGSREHAQRALDLGMVLGFGGMLTYGRAEELRRVAAEAPVDRILLETDCPYLAPEPRRGRDNEPANVAVVAECLAQARGESRERIATATTENARRVFGLGER